MEGWKNKRDQDNGKKEEVKCKYKYKYKYKNDFDFDFLFFCKGENLIKELMRRGEEEEIQRKGGTRDVV